jgi:hypothetical protein
MRDDFSQADAVDTAFAHEHPGTVHHATSRRAPLAVCSHAGLPSDR